MTTIEVQTEAIALSALELAAIRQAVAMALVKAPNEPLASALDKFNRFWWIE